MRDVLGWLGVGVALVGCAAGPVFTTPTRQVTMIEGREIALERRPYTSLVDGREIIEITAIDVAHGRGLEPSAVRALVGRIAKERATGLCEGEAVPEREIRVISWMSTVYYRCRGRILP